MRRILSLLAVLLLTERAFAQKSPKESAEIHVGVHQQITASSQYSMRVQSSVAGEADPYYAWQTNYLGLTTPAQSPNVMFQIYPGRLYTYSTGSAAWHAADVQFDVPPGYTIYMGPAYWSMTARTSFITQDYAGGSGTWLMNFYVLPSDGAARLAAGYCTPPHLGDVTWAISAGTLSCGASAGSLRWQSSTVAQSLLDASSLNFTTSAPTIDASSSTYLTDGPVPDQVATYYYPDGTIKYIGTNQVQIYVSRNSGTDSGYTIQVYSAGIPFTWTSDDPTQAWNFSGSCTDSYTISNPDSSWDGRVQIARSDTSSGQTDNWILAQSGATSSLTQTSSLRVITLVSTPISGGRTETYTVADNTGAIALQKNRTYQNFNWGEELVSEVSDPGGLALTTTYTYYNTTWADGHYSKLQSVTNPDGSWVLYNYFDDFAHWGQLASVSTPWQDSPSTYTAATSSNCKMTTHSYTSQIYDGYQSSTPVTSAYQTLDAGTQTSINGVVTSQTSIAPSVWLSAAYTSSLFSNEPMRTDTIQSYSSSGAAQTTVRTVFHNTSDPIYAGKLYSQVNPDGTKISASYWKGDFTSYFDSTNWNLSNFAPDSSSVTWVATYLSGTSTQQDSTAVLFSNDGTTGGMAIDPVWMTPYKSFRRQTVTDYYGNPQYDVNEVYTGSGFQIISWKQTGYTWNGLLGFTRDSTGSYMNESRIDGQVNYQTNPDGTQTQYFFDALMRVQRAEQKGIAASGSYMAQGAIETTYTYDGASHVLTTTKQAASGGATLTTASTYNYAGLLTSQTDNTGLTTSYAYTNGARTVTTTYPNGSTKVTDKHLDGSAKSTTGNAQVNQFTSSVVNSDGTITTTTSLGTSGSSRWSANQTDWLGRTINQSQPAFGGGTFVKGSTYNTSGQLIETTQTGMSATLYQYDGLGQLQYMALDVNNNGAIDLGGTDRITETRSQVYEDSNSVWWNQKLTYVFNQSGSSTPVLKSEVRQKLVPYASNYTDYSNGVRITETDSYDYFRNLTTEVVNSSYSTAVVSDTTTLPNSTVPKVSVTYNGLLVSSQTPQNILTTHQYDGLDRETSEVDPRKGTSYTAYFTSGPGENGQVSSRTDAAGKTTSYTYDSSDGLPFSQTDPLGNTVYHSYDHAGREIRTWGTGTYPVEYAFDAYGSRIAMRTFRNGSLNFGTSTWPLSDDGGDPQNPSPTSWTNGDTTSWTFDGATGLLTSKTDATSHSVNFTYDPNGALATRTWSRGVVTTYSYDPNTAEQTGISYSDGTPALAYTFDRLGHGSTVVQAYSGSMLTTGLQYNVPGKLTQETFDSTYFSGRQLVFQLDTATTGSLGRTIGYELGTSASPSLDQATTYAYDTYGRLNSDGLSGGPTFSYAFTANSNLISGITDSADNWSQSRSWDPNRDLLDSIQTSVGSTTEGSFSYIYDSLGRRTSKLETGALFSRYPATGLVDAYSYDSRSQVTADQAYHSNNPSSLTTPVVGRGFSYAYDPIGNRTTSSVDANSVSYTSDALNQITSRTVPGYYAVSGVSPAGATVTLNGTTIGSGQFNGQYYLQNVTASNSASPLWLTASLSSSLGGSVTANAFVPQTPEASTYDADGNLLTDGRWNYFWDGENRLKAIETYGHQSGNSTSVWTSGVPLIHIDFKYDYQGRRISKMVSNWSGSAFVEASETRYVYDNWNLASDYTVSGSTLSLNRSYLWGIDLSGNRHGAGGVGGLLAMAVASGGVELPTYDANGNVMALTDRSTGKITADYEYSPFGEVLRETGSYALVNPFRFSSKYFDDETGLFYYGHRYYNPALGRFIGRDSIEEKGGLHLYAFAANNPIGRWDYLGNAPSFFDPIFQPTGGGGLGGASGEPPIILPPVVVGGGDDGDGPSASPLGDGNYVVTDQDTDTNGNVSSNTYITGPNGTKQITPNDPPPDPPGTNGGILTVRSGSGGSGTSGVDGGGGSSPAASGPVTDGPDGSSGLTTYAGSIKYSYAALIISHGTFTGTITDGLGNKYQISGYLNGVGYQAGYFSGSTPVSFTVNSVQNIGSNGVIFTGSAGVGLGPINIIGADGSLFVNGHTGSVSGTAEGSGLLAGDNPISTETNPANPGETFTAKTTIGISVGVQGVTVTVVNPEGSAGR